MSSISSIHHHISLDDDTKYVILDDIITFPDASEVVVSYNHIFWFWEDVMIGCVLGNIAAAVNDNSNNMLLKSNIGLSRYRLAFKICLLKIIYFWRVIIIIIV